MNKLLILGIVVTVVGIVLPILFKGKGVGERDLYKYKKKKYLMTSAEHQFYDMLQSALGGEYYIFPQVHLSSLIDHKVRNGQNWKGAFSHINGKSVDYVLCDKNSISPMLAVELDDFTHEREDRKERDVEVERILQNAELSLLRIKNLENYNAQKIKEEILAQLAQK